MSRPASPRALCSIAFLVSVSLLSAACGTRQSHDQVVQAAHGGGPAAAGGSATTQDQVIGDAGTVSGGAGDPSSTTVGGDPAATSSGGSAGGSTDGSAGSAPAPGAAGQAPAGGAQAPAAAAATKGDRTPVVIGQIGDFSGIVGVAGQPMRSALAVWAKDINARGGLAGHPVQLISMDTQGSASKAQSAARSLVEDKKAVAVIAAYIGLTLPSIAKYMNDKKVPVIGGELAGDGWFKNPMFFPQGTTSALALYGILQTTAAEGKSKMALFYCTEAAVCSDVQTQMRGYSSSAKVEIVYEAQVSLAQPDFTAQCINARNAGAEAVMIVMDGGSMARIARDCGRQSYRPALWTGASILADNQKSNPDLDGVRAVSQTFPFMLSATPAQQAYQTALRRYAPNDPPAGTASMGWTSAELFRAAVESQGSRATSGPITRQLVLDGLYSLREATLGGLAPNSLTFKAGGAGNLGARCYWIVGLSKGKWVAPNGNTQACPPPGVR